MALDKSLLLTELNNVRHADALMRGSSGTIRMVLNADHLTETEWNKGVSSEAVATLIVNDIPSMTADQQASVNALLSAGTIDFTDGNVRAILVDALSAASKQAISGLARRAKTNAEFLNLGVRQVTAQDIVDVAIESIPTCNWAKMKVANELHISTLRTERQAAYNERREVDKDVIDQAGITLRNTIKAMGVYP